MRERGARFGLAAGSGSGAGAFRCGDVVAIDADFAADAQLAERVRAAAIEVCGRTPFERQGAHPKFALVYRAAEAMPSLSLKAADGSGDGLDVLADGRQLVAYGIHRRTLRPYAWIGPESPLTAGPDAAPEVTRAQIAELVRRIGALVELSATGGRKGRGGASAAIVRDAEGFVIDGCEAHLTRTVYAVARAMRAEGLDLDADALAARSWERFAETARIDDGHWGPRDAETKARAILAKWRSGRLDLDGDEPDPSGADRVKPTYPDRRRSLSEAEAATRGTIADFFGRHVPAWQAELAAWGSAVEAAETAKEAWAGRCAERARAGLERESEADPEPEEPAEPIPTSWGARIETAVGKTREAVKGIALAAKAGMVVVYAAPTHPLLSEVAEAFAALGVGARAYRGYTAADPDFPGVPMCHDLAAVEDAQNAAAASVRESVCERKINGQKLLCAFHERCGMTRQRAAKASVWQVPHALLFQARPEYIPAPDAVVIDENATMGALPDRAVRTTLDAIESADCEVPSERNAFNIASGDLEQARAHLCRALRDHPKDGALQRSILLRHHVTAALAGGAVRLEWLRLREAAIVPGMAPKARRAAVAAIGQHNRELKALAGLWRELRAFNRRSGPGADAA